MNSAEFAIAKMTRSPKNPFRFSFRLFSFIWSSIGSAHIIISSSGDCGESNPTEFVIAILLCQPQY